MNKIKTLRDGKKLTLVNIPPITEYNHKLFLDNMYELDKGDIVISTDIGDLIFVEKYEASGYKCIDIVTLFKIGSDYFYFEEWSAADGEVGGVSKGAWVDVDEWDMSDNDTGDFVLYKTEVEIKTQLRIKSK